ncbi:YqiA/YcfP family alpha/beta fold hydrolase [Acinetobacter wuhouensis]|uniref:Esterase n=1 Tax=Acinetobacter wuhouensis TaxID=1879050 RepID=A0A3G2T7T4_9GAMM|nr:YqiA/YcfP family alpha/beta fold hydrolase [Acinetobacter wuhouensis]AYO56052.1 esterase [Acinetobacter wuhouensis]
MNIIYLHGFKSSPLSIKGQQLDEYCRNHSSNNVYLPDLNQHPQMVLDQISQLIEELPDVGLVGSSLGGFYATQLVAKYGVPAVLINPAMRPWALFRELFGMEHIPLKVTEQWTLDHAQLDHLEAIAVPFVQDADKIMVLLQQGDEILDYREAERYYSAAPHSSLIMTEMHGNHAMDNFADKIPMILDFLSYSVK